MSQPARLEEDLLTDLIKSSIKMASGGFHPYRSPHSNFSPLDPV